MYLKKFSSLFTLGFYIVAKLQVKYVFKENLIFLINMYIFIIRIYLFLFIFISLIILSITSFFLHFKLLTLSHIIKFII